MLLKLFFDRFNVDSQHKPYAISKIMLKRNTGQYSIKKAFQFLSTLILFEIKMS